MGLKARMLLIGLGSMASLTVILLGSAAWQNRTFVSNAEKQLVSDADSNLEHLATSTYNLAKCRDESMQESVRRYLEVAKGVVRDTGSITLSGSKVWQAKNQFTKATVAVSLPVMSLGGKPLIGNTNPAVATPVVDSVTKMVGSATTIFQRMNAQGDMLRVATSVMGKNGKRAAGTFIPATNPDGKPNPVVASLLAGRAYHGTAYVVDKWCVSSYEPLFDGSGKVIGAIFVGVPQDSMPFLRQAIVSTTIGKSGYISVISTKPETFGKYMISKNGERDGEYLLDAKDPSGKYPVREIIAKGLKQPEGQVFTHDYMWKNPEDATPRRKMIAAVYYKPWGWMICASAYTDEFLAPVEEARTSGRNMLALLIATGIIAQAVAAYGFGIFAKGIADRVKSLASAAQAVAQGNIEKASQLLACEKADRALDESV